MKALVSEDDRSLLVLVLETNPAAWAAQLGDEPGVVDKAMNQLLLFLNAYLALRDDNLVAVFSAHFGDSTLVYANGPEGTIDAAVARRLDGDDLKGKYELFATMNHIVGQDIKTLIESAGRPPVGDTSSTLAKTLSSALCCTNQARHFFALTTGGNTDINRVLKNDDLVGVKPRILVLNMSPDSPVQFIPIMNCLFSSQKLSVPIDVCSFLSSESVFLQQAAHITGGLFVQVPNLLALLPTLMSVFLPDRHMRKLLVLPQKHNIDFRASCFCHKRLIDIGFVCSVCLSIFCNNEIQTCTTCGTKFSQQQQVRPL